jgi:uncharacterized membrane protein
MSGTLYEHIIYTNNSSGKPLSEAIYDSTNALIGNATISYDVQGRNTAISVSMTQMGMSTTMNTTMTYDANGNLTSVAIAMSMSGILVTVSTTNMSYEAY